MLKHKGICQHYLVFKGTWVHSRHPYTVFALAAACSADSNSIVCVYSTTVAVWVPKMLLYQGFKGYGGIFYAHFSQTPSLWLLISSEHLTNE